MMNPLSAANDAETIVVLAIGNLIRQDEGVGAHALRRLQTQSDLAPHVRLLDGGVLGLELLAWLEGCRKLLIIDAIDAGRPPGRVLRMERHEIPVAVQAKLSLHQAGLLDMLAALELAGTSPPELVVWGVQPAALDWGMELSPPVAAALPELLDGIRAELRRWGGLKA